MRQATTAVRLDAGRAERFSASAQSTGVSTLSVHDLPLPNTLEGAILVPQPPGIRGMSD
jgi:hypothetical protein